MKKVILVIVLAAGSLLMAIPTASATGPSFVQFGCRSGGGEATYNVASADAAKNTYGVAWSVRAIVGHYKGAQNACQTNNAVGWPAQFETHITVQRQVWNGSGLSLVDCGAGLHRQTVNPRDSFDVHYDVAPIMVDVCRVLDWPAPYTRATVTFRVIESPFLPVADKTFVINF